MAQPRLSVPGQSLKRAMAVRLCIEEKIKTTIPERVADLIESLEHDRDKLTAYLTLMPFCYPRLQVQTIIDADQMGIETDASLELKRAEWLTLQAEKQALRSV